MHQYQHLLNQAAEKNYNIGVCAKIVNDQNQILLLKRGQNDSCANIWEMPGGAVEISETLEEAIIREVKEETNLDVELNDNIIYIGHFDFHNSETDKTKRKFCFQVYAFGEIALSSDHDEYRFFDVDEIKNMKVGEEIFEDHFEIITN